MKIRCKHCGEFFYLDDETQELMSMGYIESYSVNTCDDCWDMLEHMQEDLSEMHCDADPGL